MLSKTLYLVFILQYSTGFPYSSSDIYWPSPCTFDSNCFNYEPLESETECPEGMSLLSEPDIISLIDHVAKHSKIKENIYEGYYQKAIYVNKKHEEELKKYQELVEEKPLHIKHILEQVENDRQTLLPKVTDIAQNIKAENDSEEQLLKVNNRYDKLLKTINAYDTICQLNDDNHQVLRQLKSRKRIQPLLLSPSAICGSLKNVHREITIQLQDFQNEYLKEILYLIDEKDNEFSISIESYKNQLKNKAMRLHKSVMYDILKLQDDYIHFKEDLIEFNITEILNNTKHSLERSEDLLDGLDDIVKEYGQHCVNTNSNNIPTHHSGFKMLTMNYKNIDNEMVDDLIQCKINDIKQEVEQNLTDIFKTLEEHLSDIDISEQRASNIAPRQEDLYNIKRAQELLKELKTVIPNSSLDRVVAQRQQSLDILQKIEETKKEFESKFKQRGNK